MDNEQLHEANELFGTDEELAERAYICARLSVTLPMEYMEDRFTLAALATKFLCEIKRRRNAKASN